MMGNVPMVFDHAPSMVEIAITLSFAEVSRLVPVSVSLGSHHMTAMQA